MIQFFNVEISYDGGQTLAVENVSLQIQPGEFLVLLGESGCGKTTLLKSINRLVELTSGRIEVDGQETTRINPVQLRRQIGYVFQDIGLFPHMTVGENISVVLRLLGWEKKVVRERVDELLQLIKLPPEEYRDRGASDLSGGQRQRVGVARALAGRPKIMLMDEPFGALDPLNRDVLQSEYRQLHDELGLTTVMVTHDMTEALLLADRIAVMKSGALLQAGTPSELFSRPSDPYVTRLISTPKRQADRLEELAAVREAAS